MASTTPPVSTDSPLVAAADAKSDELLQGASGLRSYVKDAKSTLLSRLAIGAAGGLAATSAMTAAMIGMQQLLPPVQRYPLPPRLIIDHVARWLGVRKDMNKQDLNVLTGVAHFSYGATTGSLYTPIGLALPLPGIVSGVAWGLLVWAGSYLGLLPGLNILPSAARQPRDRVLLMILAHVVWGASLGFVTGWLARRFGHP